MGGISDLRCDQQIKYVFEFCYDQFERNKNGKVQNPEDKVKWSLLEFNFFPKIILKIIDKHIINIIIQLPFLAQMLLTDSSKNLRERSSNN